MNISSKTREKLALQGNILRFFSPRYSQNYILNEKFNPNIESWPFLLKSGHFFRFPKKGQGRRCHLSPGCRSVMAEYSSILLNILNILSGSEYV